MTEPTPHSPDAPEDGRAPVWRAPGMPALVALTLCGFAGYSILLPLGPLWVVQGGAGPAGAGLVNGVMLASTVGAQLLVPAALRRFGWGPVLAIGLVLLGLPSLAHLASDGLTWVLLLAVVRGIGFAVLTVTGSAAAAHLVAPSRRGAAIGAYGLAVAVPNLAFLPWGPLIVDRLGWPVVFAIGALPMLGAPFGLLLARHIHAAERATLARIQPVDTDETAAAASASRPPEAAAPTPPRPQTATPTRSEFYRGLLPPAGLLLAVTLAGGAVISFAPQVVARPAVATAALFGMGLSAALARWLAGGLVDRYGAGRFVWPATTLAALCLVGVAFTLGIPTSEPVESPGEVAAWIALAAALGISYGSLQNLTYVLTLRAAGERRISTASAIWNAGFDTGTALGSVVVGAIAATAGFGWAFLAAALACAATIPLALRARRV